MPPSRRGTAISVDHVRPNLRVPYGEPSWALVACRNGRSGRYVVVSQRRFVVMGACERHKCFAGRAFP